MDSRPASRWPLVAVALLLAANIAVPLAGGDVYPFTSAPMFRDCPARCCNYRVLAPDGRELPAADWLVQRIYDGNPVGYGVGLVPPAVIEREFGIVHGEAELRRHLAPQFQHAQNRTYPFVEVVQEVIGPVENGRIGIVQTSRWRLDRP